VAEALQPIWNVLSDRLHQAFYVACDETHVQVLKENGRLAESKSWMWVRSTPFGPKKIVLFDYSPSRSSEVAKDLFLDFKGFLQCDGLGSYNPLEKNEGLTRIGCNMHARRRFEQAKVNGAKAGQSLGEIGLGFYKKLYDLEEWIREKPPDERHQIRQKLAVPIWAEMKAWVDQQKPKVPKTSKIGHAFAYFESEYEYLTGYLKDGRLEPDNGFTERAIRKFAIGRNNWMFSDSEDGANASALLYSLVITAKINGINPYQALATLLTEIPNATTLEEFERLAELILTPQARV
jgi:transposase